MTVGLVIVSHSDALSRGVVELVGQMAPEVDVLAGGGLADGAIGTDLEKVSSALSTADSGDGAVLLYDLGSARMTAELAVESLGDPDTALVADAPLAEGAVAAAVAAQGGDSREAVARAASEAARTVLSEEAQAAKTQADGIPAGQIPAGQTPAGRGTSAAPTSEQSAAREESADDELVLCNEVGLHARPAALLARTLTDLNTRVSIALGDDEADATSVLSVMGLGARKGDRVGIRATGPDARQAVERVRALVERNFDD